MGYRNYLSIVDKEVISEIQYMDYKQLVDTFGEVEESHFAPYDLPQIFLHNLGELDTLDDERMYAVGKPLFLKGETVECLSHYKPYLVGKEGLVVLINMYKEKVIEHFKGLLLDDTRGFPHDKTASQKQETYVKSMLDEWEKFPPFDMSESSDVISTSWKYEYIIFELVRQLKTVDFEKNTLIFYGY